MFLGRYLIVNFFYFLFCLSGVYGSDPSNEVKTERLRQFSRIHLSGFVLSCEDEVNEWKKQAALQELKDDYNSCSILNGGSALVYPPWIPIAPFVQGALELQYQLQKNDPPASKGLLAKAEERFTKCLSSKVSDRSGDVGFSYESFARGVRTKTDVQVSWPCMIDRGVSSDFTRRCLGLHSRWATDLPSDKQCESELSLLWERCVRWK